MYMREVFCGMLRAIVFASLVQLRVECDEAGPVENRQKRIL